MNFHSKNRNWLLLIVVGLLQLGCGDGTYDGFDDDVTLSTPNKFLTFFNGQQGDLDDDLYAGAYYARVDPDNARDTLQKFLSLHQFDTLGPDQHAIFRDSKDLGYGRDMYMRSYNSPDCGGQQVTVFYVRNFSVDIVDSFAYGPVNLEAAISDDQQYHFGTNAIEFSRGLTSAGPGETCSTEPMVKFFTYRSDYSTPNAPHPRLTRVDLDGRGEKAMPQPCTTCHGGKLRPLDRFDQMVATRANDAPVQIGDTKAGFQAFEVDSFEFSDDGGHRRSNYEDELRLMNAAIYCSYAGSSGHAACASLGGGITAQTDPGEWSGDFAREMLLGWYGSSGGLEDSNAVFDETFVPIGWTPSIGGPPVGADALFQKVIAPNCLVCHGKQGTELGTDFDALGDGKDIDFSSWDKFISYAEDIKRLVYDEGRMPLGRLNFDSFWRDTEKAELLGSFISPYVSNFAADHVDANGNINPPGSVVARAGTDRVAKQNAPITLTAQASLFADSYQWSVLSSPVGSIVNLSAANSSSTDFSADIDGSYLLRLTASSSLDNISASDELTVLVDNSLATDPRALTFYADIEPLMSSDCATGCHQAGGIPGVPVWWVADALQPIPAPPTITPSLGLYEQVMARVNLEDVENSLLLTKLSGNHHYGGQPTGFDTTLSIGTLGRVNYDLFVSWISEGGVCGVTGPECP